jgi:hypothetical protein
MSTMNRDRTCESDWHGIGRRGGIAKGPVRKPGLTWYFSGSPNGIRTRAATLRGRPGMSVEPDPIRLACSCGV